MKPVKSSSNPQNNQQNLNSQQSKERSEADSENFSKLNQNSQSLNKDSLADRSDYTSKPKIPISQIGEISSDDISIDISNKSSQQQSFDKNQNQEELSKQKVNDNDFIQELISKIAELEVKVETLSNENNDWQNKALRITADLQNLQKQHDLDIAQAKKKTKKHLIEIIMSFLNTMYLSFSYLPKDNIEQAQKLFEPLKIAFQQAIQNLKIQNIEIIVPEINEAFNTQIMNALNTPEDDSPVVKQVVSLGLRIDDQLVNPAQVMV